MADESELQATTTKQATEKAALVWSIADTLRGLYKPVEYGRVILPMTIVKRFHDCLLPTHEKVLETAKKTARLDVRDGFLRRSLTCYKGLLTHEETSALQNKPWIRPEDVLGIADRNLDPAPPATVTRSSNFYKK